MMKRTLFIPLITVAACAASEPLYSSNKATADRPVASSDAAEVASEERDRRTFDFSDIAIEGELTRPSGDLIASKPKPAERPAASHTPRTEAPPAAARPSTPAPSKEPARAPEPEPAPPPTDEPEVTVGIGYGAMGDADDGVSYGYGAGSSASAGSAGSGSTSLGSAEGSSAGGGYASGTVSGSGGLGTRGTGRGGGGASAGIGGLGKAARTKRGAAKPRARSSRESRPDRPARPTPRARRAPPSTTGVKAGAHDDNMQFNAFLDFLDDNDAEGLRHDVSLRKIIRVTDETGLPLAGARVTAMDRGARLTQRTTYADGRAMLFPSSDRSLQNQDVEVRVDYRGERHTALLGSMDHVSEIRLPLRRVVDARVPLDIAFVLDTTGSMGDEIAQLKRTLEVINFQISHLSPRPSVRFGMVTYRDRTDDYRTRIVPFTSSVEAFAARLDRIGAGGGGDYPEDVQEGLHDAMRGLKWRDEGVRVAFLIGDAPPHLDYGQRYTYVDAMREAARRGIKIAAIGASGLNITGEVVWRQLAQYTMAPFVFLTRGEKGNSEGTPSSVSHHVGSNWVADNLDAIIVRMVKVELAHYGPRGAPSREDYFSALHRPGTDAEVVLDDLFSQSIKQLTDYAVERIDPRTPTLVLPVSATAKKLDGVAGKLESRLSLALATSPRFQLLERARLGALLSATANQLSSTYDAERMIEVGKLVPARLAVLSHIESSREGPLEMMVKLVRLETGEVLSLSLLKIDRELI